ncbi:hypothetical protein [Bradyrhizobium sp. P5_C12]
MRSFGGNSQRFLPRHRRARRLWARYRRGAGVRLPNQCAFDGIARPLKVICAPAALVGELEPPQETDVMAKGQQRSNRETKKPKKDKTKVIAAAPSRKEAGWQPDFGPAKKK